MTPSLLAKLGCLFNAQLLMHLIPQYPVAVNELLRKKKKVIKLVLLAVVLTFVALEIFISYFTFCFEPIPDWTWMLNQNSPVQVYLKADKNTLLLAPNPPSCTSDLLLVIVVCSSIVRFENRKAIRETWAAQLPNDIRVVFLVGRPRTTPDTQTLMSQLQEENKVHGDIIQEEFLDTYFNLTIKTVALLKWTTAYCERARYVLKADDDVFVHVDNLVKLLKSNTDPNLFTGFRFNFNTRYATCFAKNYLPRAVYGDILFPYFFYGPSYLMSRNVVELLYPVALRTNFVYVEDLFLTGTCAEEVGVERLDHPGFLFFMRWNDRCQFREQMITAHLKGDADRKMRNVWALLNSPSLQCSRKLINDAIT